MIFTAINTHRAKVCDVDTKEEIEQVVEVNTSANTLLIFLGKVEEGEIVTKFIRFRKIYAIYGESPRPQLFHCYERIHEN